MQMIDILLKYILWYEFSNDCAAYEQKLEGPNARNTQSFASSDMNF